MEDYPSYIMYPRYSKKNPDEFKDWRKVIINSRDFDITAQVSEYIKGLREF